MISGLIITYVIPDHHFERMMDYFIRWTCEKPVYIKPYHGSKENKRLETRLKTEFENIGKPHKR